MRIIRTLGRLIGPMLSVVGFDFALNKLIDSGKIRFSRESSEKYEEIEYVYKQKLSEWAAKNGINVKKPSSREKNIIKDHINELESQALEEFSDFLRKKRKTRDLKILLAGIEMAKIFNEKLKDRIY